jgi:hypothetical protein
MIRHGDIKRAEHIINTSGIVDIFESGVRRSPRGRPAKVNDLRLLLLGMFLSVHHGGSAAITDIHRTLVEKIPLDEQYRLRIRKRSGNTSKAITYRNLEYQADRLMKALAYGPGSQPDLADEERARRQQVLTTAGTAGGTAA